MNGSGGQIGMKTGKDLRRQAVIGVIAIIVFGLGALGFLYFGRAPLGPVQPIPFSHRVHANDKKISCFFCHTEAINTARAGIPPLETCMLCHSRIAITYPPIKDLRDHYFGNKPVLWNRIHILPEFVYFNHSMHIHRQIDCSYCHGNVPHMDRIVLQQKLQMGFCIGCHKKNKVTHDCFVCHR